MIVPYTETYGSRKIKPGDKVVVTKQINRPYYCITVGHILTYIGCNKERNPGDILKDEETGLIVEEVSVLDYQYYEESIGDSEKKYINKKEKEKFLGFIKQTCTGNSGRYSSCPYFYGACKPKLSCIEHIPEKEYKDNRFILNYIRKIKIKKIR
jgi:hypothetical protein